VTNVERGGVRVRGVAEGVDLVGVEAFRCWISSFVGAGHGISTCYVWLSPKHAL
jgi:hypothetical protein